jgi:type II secretory pathway pseudopilin PulG
LKKKKGFSLIFVLVSVVLIIIFGVYVSSLILQTYKKTYDSAKYDIKMIIQKNTSGNSNEVATVEVVDKNKNSIASIGNPKSEPKILLKSEKYNIEIINKDGEIYLNLKDSSNNLIDSWQAANKMNSSDGTVILQMDDDIDVNLYVKGTNEMSDNILYIYFTKIKSSIDTNESIKYSFQNEGGIIQTYSNVYRKADK